MAASCHARSNSFATKSHSLTSELEERLKRLESSQATSSSLSIGHELNGLQDFRDSFDKRLQLPLIHRATGQGQNKKCPDELLNGSLRISEINSIARNALLQTKKSAQGLQSVLCRRRGDETELKSEIKKYIVSRKAVKKAIHKAFENSKGMDSKCSNPSSQQLISLLKEVEAITLAAFQFLLPLVSRRLVTGFRANPAQKNGMQGR